MKGLPGFLIREEMYIHGKPELYPDLYPQLLEIYKQMSLEEKDPKVFRKKWKKLYYEFVKPLIENQFR